MKLNSNTAFNLLGIVVILVLIGALMLAAWAGLSTSGIIITGVVVAAIGNFAAIILLAKFSSEQEDPIDGFNVDEVRVARTAFSTSIEILVGVLTALGWALSLKNGLFTEDDGSFSFDMLFSIFLFTGSIIFLLWDTYTPGDINNAGMLTNPKQVSLAILMNRLIAVLMAVGMLIFSFPALHQQHWIWIVLATMGVMVFVSFRILIRRAK